MNLNLTFSGTDTMLPGFMTMIRSNGSTRTATVCGSINSNGHLLLPGAFALFETAMSRTISLTTN